eukprot:498140-Hanusia_phi.AAC.2
MPPLSKAAIAEFDFMMLYYIPGPTTSQTQSQNCLPPITIHRLIEQTMRSTLPPEASRPPPSPTPRPPFRPTMDSRKGLAQCCSLPPPWP